MNTPNNDWKERCYRDDLARPTDEAAAEMDAKYFRDQSLDAVSQILAKHGIPNVVVTDMDRLQAGIIEAQAFLDTGNINEARRTLAAALRGQ